MLTAVCVIRPVYLGKLRYSYKCCDTLTQSMGYMRQCSMTPATAPAIQYTSVYHNKSRHGYRPQRKPLLKPTGLGLARAHAERKEDYWDSRLWSDETKVTGFFFHNYGFIKLHLIDGIMNSTMSCSILKERMLPSLRAHGRRALLQHDNDPEHTSKAAAAFLHKNRVKVMEWPSLPPDLKPVQHLWRILKQQVEHHSPSSIQALEEVLLEEWKKIDDANVLFNKIRHKVWHDN
uniref:Tc1-like transposase DDE domain-containing protein n=1 Tax=Nothobranchius furzeri TaxID=105023 RepID=A0A8C6NSU5_NOTFU